MSEKIDRHCRRKAASRAHLNRISLFREILNSSASCEEIFGRMNEVQELGEVFVEALHFLALFM